MIKEFVILLPPSEGKEGNNFDFNEKFGKSRKENEKNYFLKFEENRIEVEKAILNTISSSIFEELEKIFELKNDKLKNAIENNKNLNDLIAIPAHLRYTGVMYNAIDFKGLSEEKVEKLMNSIFVIDGLFGILKITDFIPDYKLKINSKLKDFNVTKFWKEKLINFDDFKDKIVLDLLPEAHKKVLNFDNFDEFFTIKFCFYKDNKLKNEGHNSKKLKGEFIQYLSQFDKISLDDLKKYSSKEGHKFSNDLSCDREIIFLKS